MTMDSRFERHCNAAGSSRKRTEVRARRRAPKLAYDVLPIWGASSVSRWRDCGCPDLPRSGIEGLVTRT